MRATRAHATIAVVGAGISGLTAAHTLAAAGHDVVVLDRRHAPGGRIFTEQRDGFLVEHGPNSLISPAPGAESLIEALGLNGDRIERGPRVKHRYLVRNGRGHALPLDALRFFGSRFFSLSGRVRMLAEPFIAPYADDEPVAQFVRRRFGCEMLNYVFDPLVGGIYAGDPERLSVSALFPQLKRLERAHGSVIRGVIATRRLNSAGSFDPRRRRLFTFGSGMGLLPNRLLHSLSGRVRLGVRVEAARPVPEGGFRLDIREGDVASTLRVASVVVALPAYAAARVLRPLSADVGTFLAAIDHPPLAVVALGYRAGDVAHPLDGLGMLTPSLERRSVLGVLFSSTLFAGRAPPGHVLLTAYVGGARQPDLARLPREQLQHMVAEESRDLLGVRGEAVFATVRYWPHGLPQPGLGHDRCVAALRGIETEWPGLFVTGNYVAGVSTAACIDAAQAVAGRVAIHLGERGQPTGSTRQGTQSAVLRSV
jgi:oxygen-dependent protoporphyrinogen oxidase